MHETKPAKTIEQQIDILKKGVIIADDNGKKIKNNIKNPHHHNSDAEPNPSNTSIPQYVVDVNRRNNK